MQVPPDRLTHARQAAKILGEEIHTKMPFVHGAKPVASDVGELVLNRTWKPQLAVTAIEAAWVLKTRLSAMEWAAVGVVCASLAMLGLAAGPEGSGHGPPQLGWALLVIVAVVFVAGAAAGRLGDRTRALILGLGAGAGFGVVEIAVRLIDPIDPTKAAFYTNPAVYAVIGGGAAGFLLLTSALSRGSVTTAVAGMVVGETVGPALVGVAWLGDRTREGLSWMVVVGFAVAVAATLALSRFGEAPSPAES